MLHVRSSGLVNYDAILKETDGIMAARGDLAMEIPSEKVYIQLDDACLGGCCSSGRATWLTGEAITVLQVALAQKYMMTKAQVAGKFLVCATEMLASMQYNPLPTRAEMTGGHVC